MILKYLIWLILLSTTLHRHDSEYNWFDLSSETLRFHGPVTSVIWIGGSSSTLSRPTEISIWRLKSTWLSEWMEWVVLLSGRWADPRMVTELLRPLWVNWLLDSLNVKGSLLQNGFCTNFSDFEAKRCSPKKAPKNVLKNAPKNAPKNGMFSPFPLNFSPNFRCVFSAVRTVNATEKRPPKNSARKSIAAQSKIQSADVAGVEVSQHALLRSKNYPGKLKISSARSSALLCLPTECLLRLVRQLKLIGSKLAGLTGNCVHHSSWSLCLWLSDSNFECSRSSFPNSPSEGLSLSLFFFNSPSQGLALSISLSFSFSFLLLLLVSIVKSVSLSFSEKFSTYIPTTILPSSISSSCLSQRHE